MHGLQIFADEIKCHRRHQWHHWNTTTTTTTTTWGMRMNNDGRFRDIEGGHKDKSGRELT